MNSGYATLHEDFKSYLAQFLLDCEMFQTML